jgi:SAM-dependent methyltransferase
MRDEYNSIKHVLPNSCSTVLDIGCGVAGIDVFIERHYSGQAPDFYLLDKSRVEQSVFYMFHEQAAFYNSLNVAGETLHANGISNGRIHLIEATDRNEIGMGAPVDLALSLLSWGFHYPVATYVERVHELLSEHGVVILDVRKGTDDIEVLRRTFGRVDIIFATGKQYRVVARK